MFKMSFSPNNENAPLALIGTYDMASTAALLNIHRNMTAQLTMEEASGYTMLGVYAVHFVYVLSKELRKEFQYQPQLEVANNSKSGQNPKTNTAVLVLVDSRRPYPVVMYEYKPVVHQDSSRVDVEAIIEMLLQTHYCMRYYKLKVVLHCLTDLKTWHYFKISQDERTTKLKIIWWHKIDFDDELTEQQLVDRTKFIISVVPDVLSTLD